MTGVQGSEAASSGEKGHQVRDIGGGGCEAGTRGAHRGAQNFVNSLAAAAGEGARGSGGDRGVGVPRRGIEKLLSDVLATASLAADNAGPVGDLSDFEILDGDDDDEEEDDDEDEPE